MTPRVWRRLSDVIECVVLTSSNDVRRPASGLVPSGKHVDAAARRLSVRVSGWREDGRLSVCFKTENERCEQVLVHSTWAGLNWTDRQHVDLVTWWRVCRSRASASRRDLAGAKLGRSVRVLWTRGTANWKTRFQKSSSRTQVQFSLVEFTCCEQTLARDGCKEWPLVQWPRRPLPYGPRRPLMKINKKNLHYSCQNRIFTPSNSVR